MTQTESDFSSKATTPDPSDSLEDLTSRDLEKEPLLPTDDEKLLKRSWWHRPNRYQPKLKNGQCCLLFSCIWFVVSTAIVLPLVFCIFIPMTIRSIIENAPPVNVKKIDLMQIHRNESIGSWFNADLKLKAPASVFYATPYHVYLLGPNEKPPGMPLAIMEMAEFGSDGEGVVLDFFTLIRDINRPNFKRAVQMAGNHLQEVIQSILSSQEKSLSSNSSLTDSQEVSIQKVPDNIWRLHMEGVSNVGLFGLLIPKVKIRQNIGLNIKTKSFIERFKPKVVTCKISNSWDEPTEDQPDCFTQKPKSLFGDDDDDDDVEFIVHATTAILNPTVFGLHFGEMQIIVETKDEDNGGALLPFATVRIPDFLLRYTQRSQSEYQNMHAKVKIDFNTYSKMKWSETKTSPLIIRGQNMKFEGYKNHTGKSSLPLSWFEQAMDKFYLEFQMKKPGMLP